MATFVLRLLCCMLILSAKGHKQRKDVGADPADSHKRLKIYNWDLTIIGHRGGAAGFIPEHSLMSYTIGAQHGADYLEPDIVFTSDGIQILQHHPNLGITTNVDTIYGKNSNKYTSEIEYWRTMDEQSPGPIPAYPEKTDGYFSWDFSFNEIKNISLISDDLKPSPFDALKLSIMKLEDLLILIINQLSPTLGRPIGIMPELKYHHEYTQRLGENVELLHLELLAKYGYLKKENSYFYVKTLCEMAYDIGLNECDEEFYGNKASVIIQSFNRPSLEIFRKYTDAPLIYLGYYQYDLMDEEFVKWVKIFADGLGVNTDGIQILKETLENMDNYDNNDLNIFQYTLGFDVNAYFEAIMNNHIINAIFTDDTNTARVIQETLDYISQNNIKIRKQDLYQNYTSLWSPYLWIIFIAFTFMFIFNIIACIFMKTSAHSYKYKTVNIDDL